MTACPAVAAAACSATSRDVGEFRAFQTLEPSSRRARRASLLALAGFLGLCLLVLAANGVLTTANIAPWYQRLRRPPGTPPDWLFAPVWTALYATVAVSAWLVWRRIGIAMHRKRAALRVWGWQLAANALWPPAFFGLHDPALGFVVITALLLAVALTMRAFWRLYRPAALLLLPYFAWCCYATYLNVGFWRLNGG